MSPKEKFSPKEELMAELKQCHCCGAPATIHLAQVISGSAVQISLCESCARKRGLLDEEGIPKTSLLNGSSLLERFTDTSLNPRCEGCGLTLSRFQQIRQAGCSHCYEVFRGPLEAIIRNVQRGVEHRGGVPESMILVTAKIPAISESLDADSPREKSPAKKRLTKAERQSRLEADLKLAVVEERYEDAIKLRDRLQALQSLTKSKSQ